MRTDGSVVCWGGNDDGKGGDFIGQATPPEGDFVSVSAGGVHTCGVKADGYAVCWGWNLYGQAMPPGETPAPTPTLVPAPMPTATTTPLRPAVPAPTATPTSASGNGKYDTDVDGLIEVSNLEQLNAIRYDLDGDSIPDSDSDAAVYGNAFPTGTEAVCNNGNGYELARPLDFDEVGSYASGIVNTGWMIGMGWLTIGSSDHGFDAIFDGNGHTVSNRYIYRITISYYTNTAGLFGYIGYIGRSGVIRELGLLDVNVTGIYGVSALAGDNSGTISASYANGNVSGSGVNIGGEHISGTGGLAGFNGGTIIASYANGSVLGRGVTVGGLIGANDSSGTIIASYATGRVSSSSIYEFVGGLVGSNSGKATSGFWDTQASAYETDVGDGDSTGVEGKTTAELQSPTGYTGIYATWNADGSDSWDFGTSSRYPALKVDLDGDGATT